MISLLFGKKKVIGLDVGTTSIKLAELEVSKKSATLIGFAVAPTPAQSYSGGEIVDPQAIGGVIRSLVAKLKSKRKNAATGLSGTSVIVKRITIPKMDEKLIAEQIRWEAEQYIPYDINEVNLGYEILRSADSSIDNMDLLLVAAVQSHVFKYVEAISAGGLSLSILDVSGFALANCFKRSYGEMKGQTVALLNIGAGATAMTILENSEVVFCRDIPVGGFNYTLDLQKGLNMSLEEAEAIKLGASTGQAVPSEAAGIIQSSHDIVCEEIKASFDFFLNTAKSQTITRCFVTGGGSRVSGLLARLSQLAPCEKLDPFFGIKVSEKSFSKDQIDQIRDLAAVAVGLGLREIGDA
jgi:type IV pilus assembly protein PilM